MAKYDAKKDIIFYNFLFNSYKCDVKIDTIHDTWGVKHFFSFVPNFNEELKFAYEPSKGLIHLNPIKISSNKESVLFKLLAVNNIDDLTKFFKKYGFFFSINKYSRLKIEADTLLSFVRDLRSVIALIQSIQNPNKTNYKNLLVNLTKIIFAPKLEIKDDKIIYYFRDEHVLQKEFDGYYNSNWLASEEEILEHIDVNTLPETSTYTDPVLGEVTYSNKEWLEIIQDSHNKKHSDYYRFLYLISKDQGNKYRLFYAILFELIRTNDVKLENALKFKNIKEIEQCDINFSNKLKEALVVLSKKIISHQINIHISTVRPKYDYEKMEPTWTINNLITALYLSLFYTKPNERMVKPCKNPNCRNGGFFYINRTNTRQSFCCAECRNAYNQAQYRLNHKANKH